VWVRLRVEGETEGGWDTEVDDKRCVTMEEEWSFGDRVVDVRESSVPPSPAVLTNSSCSLLKGCLLALSIVTGAGDASSSSLSPSWTPATESQDPRILDTASG
jgi:hypothetical protein